MGPEGREFNGIARQLQSQIESADFGVPIIGTEISIVAYTEGIDVIITGGGNMMDREGTAKVVRGAARSLNLPPETTHEETTATVTLK